MEIVLATIQSNPIAYSSGIKIENLSPLRVGMGSCESGMSQRFKRT